MCLSGTPGTLLLHAHAYCRGVGPLPSDFTRWRHSLASAFDRRANPLMPLLPLHAAAAPLPLTQAILDHVAAGGDINWYRRLLPYG